MKNSKNFLRFGNCSSYFIVHLVAFSITLQAMILSKIKYNHINIQHTPISVSFLLSRRLSSKCSSIFSGVPAITEYLKHVSCKYPGLLPSTDGTFLLFNFPPFPFLNFGLHSRPIRRLLQKINSSGQTNWPK